MSQPKIKVGDWKEEIIRILKKRRQEFIDKPYHSHPAKELSYAIEVITNNVPPDYFDELFQPLSPIEEQTNLVAEGSNVILCDGIPRRIRLDLMGISEKMIQETIWEIEKIGADVRLTNAQNLLSQAKDLVSDFIDEQLTKELPVQASVASKADGSNFSPDNNSEKTMTSKDHSRLKEGEGFEIEIDQKKVIAPNRYITGLGIKNLIRCDLTYGVWIKNYPEPDKELHDNEQADLKQPGRQQFFTGSRFTTEGAEPKEQVSNTDWKAKYTKWIISAYGIGMTSTSNFSAEIEWWERSVINPLEQQLRDANDKITSLQSSLIGKHSQLASSEAELREAKQEIERFKREANQELLEKLNVIFFNSAPGSIQNKAAEKRIKEIENLLAEAEQK